MAAVETLLGELKANAERPFCEARAAPPGIYSSEAFLALEKERIFSRQWICAGRADAIPERGDYLTFRLVDEPILIVRDHAGEVSAFSNVCRHRMSLLLAGRGNRKVITCPYHAWSYGLDGRLRHAPWMEESPAFDKRDYCLPRVRCDVWDGWIYVTLDPDIEPPKDLFRPVEEIVTGRYRFADYTETFREEHVWETNWKILAENFMESYHLFQLHRGTIGNQSKIEEMDMPAGDAVFNYHWITKESDFPLANAHPDCTYLEGEWRRTTALITVYPSHMITLTPGYFWYLSLQPEGAGRVRILYGGGMAPDFINDPKGAEHVAEAKRILDAVNEEDRVGTEAVFNGTRASLARPGHLSYLERPNFEFCQYLARRIAGSAALPDEPDSEHGDRHVHPHP